MAESVYLGSVYATFDLKADGFNQGLASAQTSVGNLKNTVLGVFAGNLLTSAFQNVTRSAVGFATESLSAFGDFETGMNFLQAVTKATGEQMDLLREKATDLGNDLTLPGVSAADAADAMTELGKAGLSVNDILAASKGVLQAAKAGNIGVAESAGYVSNALLAFGLSGTEATRVADLLAGAANATSADIPDIGLALQQVGAQAHALGIPLSDTITLIGELANVGIRGGDAGTSLKVMLQRLVPTTKEATQAYADMGITMFDANGTFVGVREAISRLQQGTAGMSQEQRQLTLSTIFGTDAYRAAATVIDAGVAGYDKLSLGVNRAGAAQDLATARTKGFKGAMEGLKSQIETLQLSVGGFMAGALRPLVDLISNNLPTAIGIAIGLMGGLLVGVIVLTGGFGALATAIWAAMAPILPFIAIGVALGALFVFLQQKFDIFGKALDFIRTIISGVYNVFKLIATGDFSGGIFGLAEDSPVISVLLTIHDVLQRIWGFIRSQFISIWASLRDIFVQLSASMQPLIEVFRQFWAEHGPQVLTVLKYVAIAVGAILIAPLVIAVGLLIAGLKLLAVVLGFVADHFDIIKRVTLVILAVVLAPLIVAVAAVIGIFIALRETVQFLGNVFATVFVAIGNVVSTVFSVIAGIWNSIFRPVFEALFIILRALATIWFTIWSGIFEIFSLIVGRIVGLVTGLLFSIVGFIYNSILLPTYNFFRAIWDGIYQILSSTMNAAYNVIAGVWNRISGVINGAVNGIVNVVRSMHGHVTGALSGVGNWLYSAGQNLLQGMVNGIRNVAGNLVKAVQDSVQGAINGAKKLLGIRSPSTVFAAIGVNTMAGYIGGVDSMGGKVADSVSSVFDNLTPLASGLNATVAALPSASGIAGSRATSDQSISTVINGNITIGSEVDADRFLARLTRNNELAQKGLTTI